MVAQLRIRNWHKFQHYKDRNPPWIKLHVDIFASEDWVVLDDASRLLAIACMVIGSKHNGMVPNNPDYIKRVAYLNKRPNLTPLIECGFLENSQADASGCKQMLADARPETETYRTEEKEISIDQFEVWWKAYPRKLGKGQARKAFAGALKKTTFEVLLEGAKRYAGQREGQDPTYTAHPATWLNGERWLDESTGLQSEISPEEAEKNRKAAEEHQAMIARSAARLEAERLSRFAPVPADDLCDIPAALRRVG